MPVIPAAWEAEIVAPGQPGKKSLWEPHLDGKMLGVVLRACHPNYGRKYKIGGL
jgi:hypothetical protein